jgi:hypothetical protein
MQKRLGGSKVRDLAMPDDLGAGDLQQILRP